MTPQQGLPNGRKVRSFTRSRDTVLDQFIRCLVHHARLSRKLRPKRGRCDYASIQINPPKKSQAADGSGQNLLHRDRAGAPIASRMRPCARIEEVIDQGNREKHCHPEGKVLARQGGGLRQACFEGWKGVIHVDATLLASVVRSYAMISRPC